MTTTSIAREATRQDAESEFALLYRILERLDMMLDIMEAERRVDLRYGDFGYRILCDRTPPPCPDADVTFTGGMRGERWGR